MSGWPGRMEQYASELAALAAGALGSEEAQRYERRAEQAREHAGIDDTPARVFDRGIATGYREMLERYEKAREHGEEEITAHIEEVYEDALKEGDLSLGEAAVVVDDGILEEDAVLESYPGRVRPTDGEYGSMVYEMNKLVKRGGGERAVSPRWYFFDEDELVDTFEDNLYVPDDDRPFDEDRYRRNTKPWDENGFLDSDGALTEEGRERAKWWTATFVEDGLRIRPMESPPMLFRHRDAVKAASHKRAVKYPLEELQDGTVEEEVLERMDRTRHGLRR